MTSMPSPVYQWRKAFLAYILSKLETSLRRELYIDVELAIIVPLMFDIYIAGLTLQMLLMILLGIHSTNYPACLSPSFLRFRSTSLVLMAWPLKRADAVRIFPYLGLEEDMSTRGSNI